MEESGYVGEGVGGDSGGSVGGGRRGSGDTKEC